MLTCALTNLKGGVGKTSLTLGLAASAVELSRRVLVVDLDPQANATLALAPDLDPDADLTVNDVLAADRPGAIVEAIRPTSWEGVDLVASQLELDARESDAAANATHRLRRAMRGLAEADRYDLVLIDCRPSVGRLTTAALVASDRALIVTDPDRAAIRGIGEALRHIEVVAEDLHPGLRLAGIVLTRADDRETEHAHRIAEIRDAYGEHLWTPTIPRRTVVPQAYGAGAPVRRMGTPAAREIADAYRAHAAHLLDEEPTHA